MTDQITYYKERASEYEIVYLKPERQTDLFKIKAFLSKHFKNENVLEIACGTAYWTEIISLNAKSILATDINESVIEMAKLKDFRNSNTTYLKKDYIAFKNEKNLFDSLFAGFFWSHILVQNLAEFVEIMLNQVKSGGTLFFIDNKYVEGNSTKISRTDTLGNTFQNRKLSAGKMFEVVKNYPTKNEIEHLFKNKSCVINFFELEYYWILKIIKT